MKLIGEKYKLDLAAAPYRGSAPMIGDMLGNQIAAGTGSVPDARNGARVRNPYILECSVLAKMTSKNQLTLPKAVVSAIGAAEYFDVEVRQGQIVLTPVRIQRGDAVRAKLAELGLGDADVAEAVQWARTGVAAHGVAEPPAQYSTAARAKGPKAAAKKKASPRK